MTTAADTQASLEADLKDEIIRMYQEVADHPDGEFHFFSRPRGSRTVRLCAPVARRGVPGRCCVVCGRRKPARAQQPAEAYGVKAVMMTALKPSGDKERIPPTR